MGIMILKMSAVTLLYVLLTYILWKKAKDIEITWGIRIAIGVLYGLCSVASTHFGIDYKDMILNVRDLGPMSAGLFFDPISGIIAGLIGGIERYIAGTYYGVGSFTRVACSVSTCFAGFFAAFMNIVIFRRKKPPVPYAFFMGAVIEVFHMYIVIITHRADMEMAFLVVRVCAIPMILFTAIGLSMSAGIIREAGNEMYNPFKHSRGEGVPVADRFQLWLFIVMATILIINFAFSYVVQSNTAVQEGRRNLVLSLDEIEETYNLLSKEEVDTDMFISHVGETGLYLLVDKYGYVISSNYEAKFVPHRMRELIKNKENKFFSDIFEGQEWMMTVGALDDGGRILVMLPYSEVYAARRMHNYETFFADILLFAATYILIAMLVQFIVVDDLKLVNKSLSKITNGELDEKVEVYNSAEFAMLSDDINTTVDALKGYIDAAEKRIEQELMLAHTIQNSALPKNFDFKREDMDIFASMHAAKEVGGDFYDFFFMDNDKLVLVMADVSGKGIPAALFMMRSKTTLRSLSETGHPINEVMTQTNHELCQGNEAEMFVTVWMAVIDLKTGKAKCINAGHEYPMLMRAGGEFELFKDEHKPPLGAMDDIIFKEYEIELNEGDCIYVYTDGVPEALNENNEQFGVERLLASLNKNKNRNMEDLLPHIKSDVVEFTCKANQFDDITMMGFKYIGAKKG